MIPRYKYCGKHVILTYSRVPVEEAIYLVRYMCSKRSCHKLAIAIRTIIDINDKIKGVFFTAEDKKWSRRSVLFQDFSDFPIQCR